MLLIRYSKDKWDSIDAFILRNIGTVLGPKDTMLNETEKAPAPP